ncbi:MAG: ABC transporter ATP-binding protein [Alphaproteobacteria bacterium]|nr:ABC transporter ATP-binding protein [Alphaproteobacteria bacterium]
MLQRILIAMVVALEPDLVVADEPTTNLDNIVERQILQLFQQLRRRLSAAFVFITHDMGVAHAVCDRIAVMYAGQVVEVAPAGALFAAPRHPYTEALLAATRARAGERLREIPGELPSAVAPPPGCLFEPRCVHAAPGCRAARPPIVALAGDPGGERSVRCVRHGA